MELLRFITAGNVDDGKSTLIGRLLHDSKAIMEDQLVALQEASAKRGGTELDLALLTDGLRAEREQGITIDVAYRYFSTPKRKFVIADCPGHIQYTRNMVTGASNASLAVLLVDVRRGLQEQTRRHCFVASLLRIPHLVICVNKMDLVDFSQEAFDRVRKEFGEFSKKLEIHDVTFIPVSALQGDNIVDKSARTPWYDGRSLLSHLEEVHISSDINYVDFRFPVQTVINASGSKGVDFRGYAGTIVSGSVKVGEELSALPSGFISRVKSIDAAGKSVLEASAPASVVIELETQLDVGRGHMLVRPNNQPRVTQDLDAIVCWMGTEPMSASRKYLLRQGTTEARALVREIAYKFDINSLGRVTEDSSIGLNDFARLRLRTSAPLFVDAYGKNRSTGSFILIDEASCATVAAGMLI